MHLYFVIVHCSVINRLGVRRTFEIPFSYEKIMLVIIFQAPPKSTKNYS